MPLGYRTIPLIRFHFPVDFPTYLEVDLSELELGDIVMLSQIQPPEGVEIPALSEDGTGDVMIANTSHSKESQGTGAAAEAEAEALALADLDVDVDVDADADVDVDADDAEPGDSEEESS